MLTYRFSVNFVSGGKLFFRIHVSIPQARVTSFSSGMPPYYALAAAVMVMGRRARTLAPWPVM